MSVVTYPHITHKLSPCYPLFPGYSVDSILRVLPRAFRQWAAKSARKRTFSYLVITHQSCVVSIVTTPTSVASSETRKQFLTLLRDVGVLPTLALESFDYPKNPQDRESEIAEQLDKQQ